MTAQGLRDLVVDALEDLKGVDVVILDVAVLTDLTDFMVVATGRSNRHVKALVDQVVEVAKGRGHQPLGIEGRETLEWVLVDLGAVVVHVMQAAAREFYELERLWTPLAADSTTGL